MKEEDNNNSDNDNNNDNTSNQHSNIIARAKNPRSTKRIVLEVSPLSPQHGRQHVNHHYEWENYHRSNNKGQRSLSSMRGRYDAAMNGMYHVANEIELQYDHTEDDDDDDNDDDDDDDTNVMHTTTATATLTSTSTAHRPRPAMSVMLYGQLLALLFALNNAIAYTLTAKFGLTAQVFQMMAMYALLSLHLLVRVFDNSNNHTEPCCCCLGRQQRMQFGQHHNRFNINDPDLFVDRSHQVEMESTTRFPPPGTTVVTNPATTGIVQAVMEQTSLDDVQASYHHQQQQPPSAPVPQYAFLPGLPPLFMPWYYYLGISTLDIGPNICILASFRYTNLTSTTLLGSLTVPSTMIFGKWILRRRFVVPYQYIGTFLCVVGGCLTIWADSSSSNSHVNADNDNNNNNHNQTIIILNERFWNDSLLIQSSQMQSDLILNDIDDTDQSSTPQHDLAYIGDLLAMLAAALYGLGDVVGEYSVKHVDRMEYLGMLGFFGFMYSIVYVMVWERSLVIVWFQSLFHDADHDRFWSAMALLLSYTLCVSASYMGSAAFLVQSDATMFNLSLQASNVWAIIFTVFADHVMPPLLFYVAVLLVIVGVVVYENWSTTSMSHRQQQ